MDIMPKKHGRQYPSFEERFWSKVNKTDSCWIWTGGTASTGYGQVHLNGKQVKAHRASWIIHNGPIPDHDSYHGLVVMHACDNPACVNPAHLSLGTVRDNNIDRQNKGRTKNIEEGRARHHAAQRAITHCPSGHEYAGSNVRFRSNGARYCGECYRLRCAAYTKLKQERRTQEKSTIKEI